MKVYSSEQTAPRVPMIFSAIGLSIFITSPSGSMVCVIGRPSMYCIIPKAAQPRSPSTILWREEEKGKKKKKIELGREGGRRIGSQMLGFVYTCCKCSSA